MARKTFVPEAEQYMIAHMNDDHTEANLLYAQVYGKFAQATAARMVSLDREGMELDVTLPEGVQRTRILFDHCLQDGKDAGHTLVALARQAQTLLDEQRQAGARQRS